MKEKLELLNRVPEVAIDRAARTLLNLRESWEWATREERKMLVRTMIQEVGCDVGSKHILWVTARPDYEPLFSILDGLYPDAERRYLVECFEAKEDNCDIEEDTGQMSTSVEILLQIPDKTCTCLANTLTSAEEYIQ